MKTIIPSSMRDIKKMFAKEHVVVYSDLFGTVYIDKKTGQNMSKARALRFLSGDYQEGDKGSTSPDYASEAQVQVCT